MIQGKFCNWAWMTKSEIVRNNEKCSKDISQVSNMVILEQKIHIYLHHSIVSLIRMKFWKVIIYG